MTDKVATAVLNGNTARDVIHNTDTFSSDGRAVVFKDNKSDDKYVVFGIGCSYEDDGTIHPETWDYVHKELVPGVERSFDFTATDEVYEFKADDPWQDDKTAPSSDLLSSIFGIQDSAMKIS